MLNLKAIKTYCLVNSLEELQHRLTVTPLDITNGNVAVIYVKNYVLNFMKEVGLKENHENTSKTFETYEDKSNRRLINITVKLFLKILIFLLMLTKMTIINYWRPKIQKSYTKGTILDI